MKYDRTDYLAVGEVQDFIDFFEYEVEVNSTNKEQYKKEIQLRDALNIFNSDMITIRKVYALSNIYKDGNKLRKAFSKLRKYEDDEFIKGYLNKIDELANYIDDANEKGLTNESKFLVEHEDYFDNYKWAIAIIEKYRKSPRMFIDDFLDDIGLNRRDFEYFVEIGKNTNPYLEIIYKEKVNESIRDRKYNTRKCFEAMYQGITTGITPEGIPFDELECYSLFPFRNTKNLDELIKDFKAKNASSLNGKIANLLNEAMPVNKAITIYDYMLNHNIIPRVDNHVSEKEILNTKNIVNGKEVTKEQKEVMIKYLRVRKAPTYPRVITLVRDKVLSGNIFYDNEEKVLKMKK